MNADKVVKVTAPTVEPVTLDEAKAQLRLTAGFTADDSYITSLISVARDRVENYCNRYFAAQTVVHIWETAFPATEFYIAVPDVAAIDSVKYIDTEGAEQTIDVADYSYDAQRQVLTPATSWPLAVAVKVQFTTAEPVELVGVKQAMLMIITDLYELRTETVVGASLADNPAVKALLYPYRVNLGI